MKFPTLDDIDLLRTLKVFASSIELRSFSAAARQLGITPGAVSKHVGVLEAALGKRLFQRTTRQVTPTQDGHLLYDLVRGPAAELMDALASFSGAEKQYLGKVTVSLPMAFSRTAILPRLPEFQLRYPEITLDLRFENRHVDLVAEGLDCAIGNVPDGGSASLIARPLLPLARVLCASPDYLKKHAKIKTLEDLKEHALILFRSPNTGRVQPWSLDHADGKEVIIPQGKIVVSDTDALKLLTLAACGVSLLGVHHGLEEFASGKLRRILPAYKSVRPDIAIYYPARKHLPQRVRAFVDFIIDIMRESDFVGSAAKHSA
ncbi:MAG: LysR family transcriptional regulator [Pseudomonadota bacterium]